MLPFPQLQLGLLITTLLIILAPTATISGAPSPSISPTASPQLLSISAEDASLVGNTSPSIQVSPSRVAK